MTPKSGPAYTASRRFVYIGVENESRFTNCQILEAVADWRRRFVYIGVENEFKIQILPISGSHGDTGGVDL